MTCIEEGCGIELTIHNPDIRCYHHGRLHVELQEYVEHREQVIVGLEKWASGQTSKRHIRDRYVRKFKNKGVIPWEATLEEVEVCSRDLLVELRDALAEINMLNGFLDKGKSMDTRIESFTYDEAVLVNTMIPETNFLTRWRAVKTTGFYQRFRSPLDEIERVSKHHSIVRGLESCAI